MGVLGMTLPIWDGPMQTGSRTIDEWAKGQLGTLARRAGMRVPATTEVSETPPLLARVNHNRWIVDCPDCGGAEFVWPESLMMCANCWNGMVGHRWRRVKLPKNKGDIEDALTVRPVPSNRNWEPRETVATLHSENKQRGLPESRRASFREGV